MKNKNWRRIAIILSLVVAGILCYGVGYAMGALDTAKFVVSSAEAFMEYQEIVIGKADLMEFFIKLKGGTI